MHILLTDIVTLYRLFEIMRIMISNEKVFSSILSNNDYLNTTQYRKLQNHCLYDMCVEITESFVQNLNFKSFDKNFVKANKLLIKLKSRFHEIFLGGVWKN